MKGRDWNKLLSNLLLYMCDKCAGIDRSHSLLVPYPAATAAAGFFSSATLMMDNCTVPELLP